MFHEGQTLLIFKSTWVHPRLVLVESLMLIFLVFCVEFFLCACLQSVCCPVFYPYLWIDHSFDCLLCVLSRILPVSLDLPFFWLPPLCLVPYSIRVSGLTILLIASSVSCPVFYPCLWIDHSFDCLLRVLSRILPVFLDWSFFWLPPLCLVPYSTRVSGLTILLIASSVSCPIFYPCLWIDHSFDCLLCVLSRILPVSLDWPFFWLPPLCLVPYSTRVSGLTILLIASSVSCPVFYPCLWINHSFDCLLCVLSRILPVSLDWPFFWLPPLCLVPYSTRVSGLTILLIASSVSCPVFYPCLWIDHSFDCLLCVLSCILPVSLDWPFFWLPPTCLVPYSTRVSGLIILLIASSVSCSVFYPCLWINHSFDCLLCVLSRILLVSLWIDHSFDFLLGVL